VQPSELNPQYCQKKKKIYQVKIERLLYKFTDFYGKGLKIRILRVILTSFDRIMVNASSILVLKTMREFKSEFKSAEYIKFRKVYPTY
jgi:hypothetical protein